MGTDEACPIVQPWSLLQLKRSVLGTIVLCGKHVGFSSNVMSICSLGSEFTAVCGRLVDILLLSLGIVEVLSF